MTATISGDTGIDLIQDGAVATAAKLANNVVTDPKLANPPVRGARTAFTAVVATTLINTIPSWATEIVVLLSSFGTNGASQPVLRLGPSGGPETTGYLGATGATLGTTGIALTDGFSSLGVAHIVITLRLIDAATNTWMAQGSMSRSDGASSSSIAATKPLAGALTQLQVTTTGGTDTMDTTGFYNVWYR